MANMETGESALLRIMLKHLEEALLDHYTKVVAAVRAQPSIAAHLPTFERRPMLKDACFNYEALSANAIHS